MWVGNMMDCHLALRALHLHKDMYRYTVYRYVHVSVYANLNAHAPP